MRYTTDDLKRVMMETLMALHKDEIPTGKALAMSKVSHQVSTVLRLEIEHIRFGGGELVIPINKIPALGLAK